MTGTDPTKNLDDGGLAIDNITPTRPCKVDGAPAYFHRFVDKDRMLLKVNTFAKPENEQAIFRRIYNEGVINPACDVKFLRETHALIEWPDGRLCTVALERVQFTDREG
jgi:hypothetical protein